MLTDSGGMTDAPGGGLADALDRLPRLVADAELSRFDEADLHRVLSAARRSQRALDALVARLGVRADELAAVGAAAPAEEMLGRSGEVRGITARRDAARASAIAATPELGDALAGGLISGDHVDSVARHTRRLSDDAVERFDMGDVVTKAGALPADTFDRYVKRAVDAALDDGGLADALAKRACSELRHWYDEREGMGRISGSLDPERYEIFKQAVDRRMATIASAADGESVELGPNLAAEALIELLSTGGGDRAVPSISVVVDERTLRAGAHADGVCETAAGRPVPPETVARLCCDAVLRRVTLDERGVPLNVGRRHRVATDAQWAAVKAIHATCAWPGCTRSVDDTQLHHIHEWEHGGPTDLCNLVPLCHTHHHRVHEGRWRIEMGNDRSIGVRRPDGTPARAEGPPTRWGQHHGDGSAERPPP